MARIASSFNRKGAKYKPQPKVLVVCEDKKSGKSYLEDACYHFRITNEVKIIHCGKTDPLGIVTEATEHRDTYDLIYCVIDRDSHENFDEALNVAQAREKIEIIASYPCFEFWLLIHFIGNNRKPYCVSGKNSAADMLVKDLKKHPGFESYDKGEDKNIFAMLLGDKLDKARKEAPRILDDAIKCGEMNPSTKLHELIDFLEKLSSPQKISN